MKSFLSPVLSVVLLWGVSSVKAQEPATTTVPGEIATSMGSSNASLCYTAQTLFGKLFDADVSTEEKLRSALLAAGGTKGGMGGAKDNLAATQQYFSGADTASLQSLIDCMALLDEQSDALIAHLRAKGQGSTDDAAIAKYRSKRSAASEILVELGFPLEMVE